MATIVGGRDERGRITESVVEYAAPAWLENTGWPVTHGPDITPDMPVAARMGCGEVLQGRWLWVR